MYLQILIAMPGGTELVLILLVILLFFGGKKIPGLMRGLGRSVREFNEAREGKGSSTDKSSDTTKETADSTVSESQN